MRVRFLKTVHVEQTRYAAGHECDAAEVEPGALASLLRLRDVEPVTAPDPAAEFAAVMEGGAKPVVLGPAKPPAIRAGADEPGDDDRAEAEGTDGEAVNLDTLTVPELKKFAAEQSIDLGDATKKADIIAAILTAQEAAAGGGE